MKQLELPFWRTVKEYGLIMIGLLLYAVAWVCIITPAGITGGGVSGASLLVYYMTGGVEGGIPMGYTFFVINAVLVGLAMWLIGATVGAKTIFAIFCISIFMNLAQEFLPPDMLGDLSKDKLLSAILGGAVAGMGVSICFAQGGTTGGTDIIALIINKYRTISYGKILVFCDLFIIGGSYFVIKDITAIIYAYVLLAAFGYMVDNFTAGNKQSSQILIVSKKSAEIADHIFKHVHRGVTMIDGEGWYTKEKMKIVMVVCRRNEISTLFRVIKEVDPKAFMTVGSVMGVYGLGFESLKAKD